MDALSDVLRVAHLTGGAFLHADFFASPRSGRRPTSFSVTRRGLRFVGNVEIEEDRVAVVHGSKLPLQRPTELYRPFLQFPD